MTLLLLVAPIRDKKLGPLTSDLSKVSNEYLCSMIWRIGTGSWVLRLLYNVFYSSSNTIADWVSYGDCASSLVGFIII